MGKEPEMVDEFLERQSRGGISASAGAFTLSPREAREKMNAAGLADPGDYVLKIVQAAVAAGCPALQVSVKRDTLSFRLAPVEQLFLSADEYASSILNLATLPSGWLRHLAVGINAATRADIEEVSWRTPGGSVVLDRQELRIEAPAMGFELKFRKRRRLWRTLFGTQFANEYAVLQARCFLAPLDLTIDSRPVERPFPGRHAKFLPAPVTDYILYESILPGSGLRLRLPDHGSYRMLRKGVRIPSRALSKKSYPLLIFGDGPGSGTLKTAGGSISVLPVTSSQGTVVFVKDGVTLQRWSGLLGKGYVIALLDGNDLSVDMTEFKAVEDEVFLNRVELIKKLVAEGLSRLEISDLNESLSRLSPLEPRRSYKLIDNWMWLRNIESASELYPIEASQVLLGVEPFPQERILLSLTAIKRFPMHAHLNCRAVATNRRLLFWDADSTYHSWFLLWSEFKECELQVSYITDIHLVRKGEPTLEMALSREEDMQAMKAIIEELTA